ncbi:MAG: tyrosine-type recombinase/integrase [Flavipsychrobacter sp.]|nr:tyrosine-type recombinase/integrase [Flavipsychrobacter sp.]
MDIQILAHQFYEYSLSIKGYSKSTIRRYKFVINFFCKSAEMSKLNEVSEEKVRRFFYHGRIERKWSTQTYIVYHVSLLVFFRWCIKQGLMSKNPIEEIEIPKVEKRLPKCLNTQNSLRLLEIVYNYSYSHKYLRYRNHAILATFLYAGLRKQELLNLNLTDVDIEHLSIFVRQGKGNKDRIVPISFTLAQSLKRYLDERKKLHKTCPQFFASYNRNLGYTDQGLRRLVADLSVSLGIRFSVHRLRHTFATLMLEGGCDIYSLSKMMGHSDIKTTTIYLSASAEHLRSQMTKHPLNMPTV